MYCTLRADWEAARFFDPCSRRETRFLSFSLSPCVCLFFPLCPKIPRRSKGPAPLHTSLTLPISPIHFLRDISRLALSSSSHIMSVYLGGSLLLHALPPVPGLLPPLPSLFVRLPEQSAPSLPAATAYKKDHIHVSPTSFAFLPLLWPTTDLLRTPGAPRLQQRVSPQQPSLLALPVAYA